MVLVKDRPYQASGSILNDYIQRGIRAIEARADQQTQNALEKSILNHEDFGKEHLRDARMQRLTYDPHAIPLN